MRFCECGCGQPTMLAKKTEASKGRIKGQPLRFLPNHHLYSASSEYAEDENGCWVWQRSRNAKGYGVLKRHGEHLAHRAYYVARYGKIPAGSQLDHLCRNRACVNPDHLAVVSPSENAQNRIGGRGASAYRGVSRLHGKWAAHATLNGVQHYLGRYDDEREAAEVASTWRREHMPHSLLDIT